MTPAKKDFTIIQGSTWRYAMLLPDLDLTGAKARMQLRKSYDTDPPIIELTTENARISIDPVDSRIVLNLSPADTAELDFKSAIYDLEVELSNTDVFRIIEGRMTLSREVTR